VENPIQALNQKLPSAASRLSQIPKVTPEMMMIVYLDEIAGRLAELQDTWSEFLAEGDLQSRKYSVTDSPTRIFVNASYLSLHNDGSDSIYLLTEKGQPLGESEIKKNGSLNLDFKTKKVRMFHLVCASGETATVRTFTW